MSQAKDGASARPVATNPNDERAGALGGPMHHRVTLFISMTAVVLAIVLRLSLFGFEGNDYRFFFKPWSDYIASHGGLRALGQRFSDYPPAYLYLLALATSLPIRDLYAIKLISVFFDVVLASGVALLVRKQRSGRHLPAFAFVAVMLAPTVFVNSAMWGQCDSIFTAFLVLTIHFVISRQPTLAMLAYGTAFSFKVQAIFLLPLVMVLLLKRALRLRHLLLVPATYVISVLPAAILGRPLYDLLVTYVYQAGAFKDLTMGAPNLYQWLPNANQQMFRTAGIVLTLCVVCAVVLLESANSHPLRPEGVVRLALLSALVMPFFLPGMHERYFYAADVLAIAFAFFIARHVAVPFVVGLTSLLAYLPFLCGKTVIDNSYLALAMLGVIFVVGKEWVSSLNLTSQVG